MHYHLQSYTVWCVFIGFSFLPFVIRWYFVYQSVSTQPAVIIGAPPAALVGRWRRSSYRQWSVVIDSLVDRAASQRMTALICADLMLVTAWLILPCVTTSVSPRSPPSSSSSSISPVIPRYIPPSTARLCDRRRLFICWIISRITQKVTGGFSWNFQGRLDLAKLKGCSILLVIRFGIWIQDRIFGLFTIAS